jgi:hypothetical protein
MAEPEATKTPNNHYINNEEFLEELIKLKETDEISEKLHVMFFDLAKNYANIPRFRYYSYIDDMIVEAYMNCVHIARKFDTEKYKNPFAYFTVSIHRNFFGFINKEKKEQQRKWRSLRILYEKYQYEDGISLTLLEGIKERMYAGDEISKPSKKVEVDPVKEKDWEKDIKVQDETGQD